MTDPLNNNGVMEMDQASGGQSIGSGAPWIVQHFGFGSVDDYIEWIDLLTEEEFFEHVAEVLALLLGS